MRGEPAIEHCKIGMHEIEQAPVVLQQFLKEEMRLFHHRCLEQRVVLRVELFVGIGEVDLPQEQPLAGEIFGESARLRVLEQALGLRAQHGGRRERALRGGPQEFFVGRGAPEEIAAFPVRRISVKSW